MSLTPEQLRRLVRWDLIVAGLGSLFAIWATSLLVAGGLGFIDPENADKVVAGVCIVICLASLTWWAAGPRSMLRDRYFVLVPVFLAAGPGIYALHDLGAGPVAVALSSAIGFFGAAVLGMALSRRHSA